VKKIPTVFVRDQITKLVTSEITPGYELFLTAGIPTMKLDGTSCMVRDGKLYKRYDAKKGSTPPVGFEPAQLEPDEITGHWPGWIPVGEGNDDKWHREAFATPILNPLLDGTYELIGPKVQSNPYKLDKHYLVAHGVQLLSAPETFNELRQYLSTFDGEGIVWWYKGEPVCKLKRRDFGFEWPIKERENTKEAQSNG